MRTALYASIALVMGAASLVRAAPSPKEDLPRTIASLSGESCYGIASGSIVMPAMTDPDALAKSVKAIGTMGLGYGVNDSMMKALGKPGLMMIAQSTMGSKSLDQGDVVLAVGGRQPGCRVILLAEPSVNVTQAVAARLVQAGWKAMPSMTEARGAIERRAFVRRDGKASPYLMNLMTVTTPAPGSKLRLFTTTIAIPDHVRLPDGL